ncbi:uncharacterized protein [Panulirus ornatus]|uniref:uncharacterized protein n=1 Tax=Panulirus ornatus TaxID=150431 RepID=UPI003A868A30
MMRTFLILSLLVGVALAEEGQEDGKAIIETVSGIALIKAIFNVAIQIVIMIALILLISTLKATTGDLFDLFGKGHGGDYDYYYVPAHDTSGSSTYTGYSKRSADTPSFMDLPIFQRLAERVQNAIENFEY